MIDDLELVLAPPPDCAPAELDRIPALRRAFSVRAARYVVDDPDAHWFRKFGVARQNDWPAGAFRGAFDPSVQVYCADPVGLAVEGDGVVVDALAARDLVQADAERLVALLDAHFAADGMRIALASAAQWTLVVPRALDAATTPLIAAHRRSMEPLLPQGRDARALKRIATEAQMLLHDCGVNQAREARGLTPLNGLWLWGGGHGVAATAPAGDMRVHSNQAHVAGLARAAGAAVDPAPQAISDLDRAGSAKRVVLDLCHVPAADDDWPRWLDEAWLAPLAAQARGRHVRIVLLLPHATVWAPLFERDWARLFSRRGLAGLMQAAGRSA